jgi:hypothetical protein
MLNLTKKFPQTQKKPHKSKLKQKIAAKQNTPNPKSCKNAPTSHSHSLFTYSLSGWERNAREGENATHYKVQKTFDLSKFDVHGGAVLHRKSPR